jgi:hypothetical protein
MERDEMWVSAWGTRISLNPAESIALLRRLRVTASVSSERIIPDRQIVASQNPSRRCESGYLIPLPHAFKLAQSVT